MEMWKIGYWLDKSILRFGFVIDRYLQPFDYRIYVLNITWAPGRHYLFKIMSPEACEVINNKITDNVGNAIPCPDLRAGHAEWRAWIQRSNKWYERRKRFVMQFHPSKRLQT